MSNLLQNVYDGKIDKNNFEIQYIGIKKSVNDMRNAQNKRYSNNRESILNLGSKLISIFEPSRVSKNI